MRITSSARCIKCMNCAETMPWTPCRIEFIITEHQHCYKAYWYLRIINSITGSTWYIHTATVNTLLQPHVLTRPYSQVVCTTKLIYTCARAHENTNVHLYILWSNQQIQLYAVNFIPLLGSLYMFRVFCTPIIRSTIFNCVYSHWYKP